MEATYFAKNTEWTYSKLENGGIIPVDKPLDWTSFDVVAKIRNRFKKALNKKKIKVGHSGTLDPKATGLLLIAFGKATKQLHHLTDADKCYRGVLQLGAKTETYDTESEVSEIFPTDHIQQESLDQIKEGFLGTINQLPPIYSAIKKDGVPLYKYARKGKKVEIQARKIEIYQLELRLIEDMKVEFMVACSKGTYVRSLAHDIGIALQSGAYLVSLQRTSINQYQLEEAWNLQQLINQLEKIV
jgi:tRNA pseudouridine55 synthase